MPHPQNPIIALNCSDKSSLNTVSKGKERSKSRSNSPKKHLVESEQTKVKEEQEHKSLQSSDAVDKKVSTSTASSRKISP